MVYLIGQIARSTVAVTDADDNLTDPVSLTALVTMPDATTAAPTPTKVSTGTYRVEHTTTMAGRHVVKWTATTPAGVWAEAFEVAAVTTSAPVTLATVKTYLGSTSVSDGEISNALTAETAAQEAACKVPANYPAGLSEALKRRVARNLALRGIPLAVLQGDAESGSTVLPGRDPEIRRLEAPYRRLKVG